MRYLLVMLLAAFPASGDDLGPQLFALHCASCHGATAEGDGPLGDLLTIRPADLTRLAERNDGQFPLNSVLMRVDGTLDVRAHGGPMPVFGVILDGPMELMKAPDGTDLAAPEALVDIARWLMSVQK